MNAPVLPPRPLSSEQCAAPCGAPMTKGASETWYDGIFTETQFFCDAGHVWAYKHDRVWQSSGWRYVGVCAPVREVAG